jgi:hypothetical protein
MSMQMRILGLVGAALVTSLLLLFFLVDPTSSPDEDVPPGGPLAGGEWDGRGRGNLTQREAETFDDFDLYWLGPHYEGLNLQAILHTPQGQEVSFITGAVAFQRTGASLRGAPDRQGAASLQDPTQGSGRKPAAHDFARPGFNEPSGN